MCVYIFCAVFIHSHSCRDKQGLRERGSGKNGHQFSSSETRVVHIEPMITCILNSASMYS